MLLVRDWLALKSELDPLQALTDITRPGMIQRAACSLDDRTAIATRYKVVEKVPVLVIGSTPKPRSSKSSPRLASCGRQQQPHLQSHRCPSTVHDDSTKVYPDLSAASLRPKAHLPHIHPTFRPGTHHRLQTSHAIKTSRNPKRPWRRSLRHPQSPTRRPPRLPSPINIPNPNTLDSFRPKPHYGLPPLRRLLHVRRRLPHFARIRMASRIVGARGFIRGIADRRKGVAEIRGGATVYFS